MENNYFIELNRIDVSDKIEKKNNLSYLSWAWAWGTLKTVHPDATYTVYDNAQGWNYHTDGRTAWVKTGVTVNGIEHIEMLPVMDFRNASIPLEKITSYDVNKAIQRSLTKAVARHGLGLYIYAGEDLPEGEEPEQEERMKKAPAKKESKHQPSDESPSRANVLRDLINGSTIGRDMVVEWVKKRYGDAATVENISDEQFTSLRDAISKAIKAAQTSAEAKAKP